MTFAATEDERNKKKHLEIKCETNKEEKKKRNDETIIVCTDGYCECDISAAADFFL